MISYPQNPKQEAPKSLAKEVPPRGTAHLPRWTIVQSTRFLRVRSRIYLLWAPKLCEFSPVQRSRVSYVTEIWSRPRFSPVKNAQKEELWKFSARQKRLMCHNTSGSKTNRYVQYNVEHNQGIHCASRQVMWSAETPSFWLIDSYIVKIICITYHFF